ncbi:MAG: hypothetical protein IJT49_00800 [Clostridia bacterium]|nr:hypothetical protein [Clostridia bacterium]
MKKLIVIFLIICLSASLFACTDEPAVTVTDTESAADPVNTETETDAAVTETETERTTETETQEQTETETGTSESGDPAVYAIYDPSFVKTEYEGTLYLYDNGEYKTECTCTRSVGAYPFYLKLNEAGIYWLDDQGIDLKTKRKEISVKITFDSEEDKNAVLSVMKSQYLTGIISGNAYDFVEKAANGGYHGSADEFTNVMEIDPVFANLSSIAVLDNDTKTAYFQIRGFVPSDNEYIILDNGYILVLYGDGVCRMRYESLKEDEKGFGTFIATDIYEGTYTRSGDQVTCTVTQDTLKYKFIEESSEKAYKEYYEEQYSGGFLGKVYYDYYMAIISEGGYTDDDMSDKYIITLEEHTHTAVILESPETEG